MKRPLLIILGIIVVLILIGIWIYVLLTGTPTNTQQFNEFGFSDTTDTTFDANQTNQNADPVVNVTDSNPLRQLTTKPVAGFAQVQPTASSTPRVHYVETGTGHIYAIDLTTGEEVRIAATTVPLTTAAVLTPNGAHVMMQAGKGTNTEFIIGTIATTSDELSNFALSEEVVSFAATAENELLYAVADGNNTLAKAYNPHTNIARVLFTIPFRAVSIDWHHTAAGPHLVTPTTASRLEGFVYSYTNGAVSRLPISGYGLSAVGSTDLVISSNVTSAGDYVTNGFNYFDSTTLAAPISIIPEKCAFSPTQITSAICGASLVEYSSFMPDIWYRGEVTFADSLWLMQPEFGSARLLENIPDSTGQTIDLINPQFSTTGDNYYFQNKIDQTLWMYEFNR